jgi:eukaryotic-like serine/threonine-protein kinase
MPEPPRTGDAVLELVRKSELADDDVLKVFLQQSGPLPSSADDTATRLVLSGILTEFQARFILQGKHKGFRLGPYRLLDQIGAGGMGQVYLAEHVHLHRRVAIKVLPSRLASDKSGVQRFYREARAVAALDHPNVVRAYDVAFESNAHFLVLEYIQGRSLEEVLAEAGGRLPVSTACDYVVQAAAGLQHAHDKGISHRDIKPANLLVNPDGVVKILDMGLAKFFQNTTIPSTESQEPGAVMGTADYIAPEQAIACSAADHRADIYSLGATLYHLVTGEPPFQGTLAAKLIAHQLHEVPTAHEIREDVPEGVSDIIAKMMAKEPSQRYQTAAEVVQALLPYTEHLPIATTTSSGRMVSLVIQKQEVAPVLTNPNPNPNTNPNPNPNTNKRLVIGLWAAIILLSAVIAAMLLK